jgi:hypothetical protein
VSKAVQVVAVVWEDAAANTETWLTEEHAEAFAQGSSPCVTVGRIVADTDKGITLAACWGPDDRGGLWRIPRGMVREVIQVGTVPAVGDDQ